VSAYRRRRGLRRPANVRFPMFSWVASAARKATTGLALAAGRHHHPGPSLSRLRRHRGRSSATVPARSAWWAPRAAICLLLGNVIFKRGVSLVSRGTILSARVCQRNAAVNRPSGAPEDQRTPRAPLARCQSNGKGQIRRAVGQIPPAAVRRRQLRHRIRPGPVTLISVISPSLAPCAACPA
jgi:hypothetical protein